MEKNFKGPLFIVGLSRSGTKLIRGLLNQNNKILLPKYESHFIPEVLSDIDLNINDLYNKISRSTFVSKFPEIEWPSISRLNQICPINNKSNLIEAVLKYYALNDLNKTWDNEVIWGDKTPLYLRYLDLLFNNFPNCKFIHIIRDPRDRAISVKKTWGKSMFRATELWKNEIEDAIKWRNRTDSYIEIKYEELVKNTEKVLKDLCIFLNIEYTEEMLTLNKPTEKYGKNSNKVSVGKTSISKYNFEGKKKIKRIEEIAYPIMKQTGYEIKYANRHKKYPQFKMYIYKFVDFINFEINNKIKGY